MTHIAFLILGLGSGAVIAALALALVMTHRSSGVVNFATGAMALYTAYNFAYLREGRLFNPVPGMPDGIDLPFEPGTGGAMAIALLMAGVLGVVVQWLIFRPLRAAPAVAKAVASLGLMLLLQGLMILKVGTVSIVTDPIFPDGLVEIGDYQIAVGVLCLAAVVVALGAAVWAIGRYTRFGLATRAVAESEEGALVTGLSPQRIAMASWAVSAVVAGAAGILIAPIAPLAPASYTLYVVPALAAALVAGFSSIPVAVLVGLAIGALNSEFGHLQAGSGITWLNANAVTALVPLVLIFGYLVVRGRPLPVRGALVLRTLGRAPQPRGVMIPAVVGTVLGLAVLLSTSGGYRGAITTAMIMAVIGLSMVVVTGYAGQVSLAQLSLAGISAFSLHFLTVRLHLPFPIAPLLAAAVSTAVGVVFGLPALRVRGLSVAMITLALAVAVDAVWFGNPGLTDGGRTGVPGPVLFGLNLAPGIGLDQNRFAFGALCLVVLVAMALAVAWLRRSGLGGRMLAVRADERSAAASGIDVVRTKVAAFAIGGFLAGIGGALLAYQQTLAVASQYAPLTGLALFGTVYLAGVTSISGGLLSGAMAAGGIISVLFLNLFGEASWYNSLAAVGLIVTVVLYPEGLVGYYHALGDRLRKRLRRAGPAVPMDGPPAEPEPPAPAAPAGGGEILFLANVGVRYGGVVAVDEVSLSVPSGKLVGLIGPNGAGKTTLIDAISGFVDYTGEVRFDGVPLDGVPAFRRVRRGLGRTFQGIGLYEDLSVAENVTVGVGPARPGDPAVGMPVARVLSLLGLGELRDRPVRELSQGHRQLTSVARALAGAPGLLLLDEPAAGLDSTESAWLGEQLKRIRDGGVSIVMVDHDMDLVMSACDLVYVLDLGRLIASGTPAEIRANPRVTEAYLGSVGIQEVG
ncbi:ABC transporter permease subunit [Amycolatopsis pigmentata]|uniref:ATP-binding cassette domain-containing protein n=1 Tax=Amycolatopsis pigmentata TaxID=450801 RepID=A0ABW5FRV9_9PSEU